MIRTSDRLAEKRSLPDPIQSESSVTTSDSANESKLSAGAKRNRRYRQRLKDDPLQYNAYREKETQRLKIYKANLTLEQKDFEREKTRIRVAEWRKRQKELGKPLKNPKPQTRACVEERREKDRLRQQRYRAGLAQRPQKRGWMTKKKLQQEEAKKRVEMLEPSSTEKSPACTPALKSKETLKLIKKLPKDPQLFAEVIEEVVETVQFTSPRKKHALQLKNILPRFARREIAFSTAVLDEVTESYQQLKNLKTSAHNVKRAALANILLKANKRSSINFIRKKYGLSYHYIKKCQTQTFERKQSRCAMPKETIQKVVDFFKRGDISRCDPSPASVSKKTHAPRRYMEKTLKDAYKQFVEETKIEISFSKFAKCRPKEIKGVKLTKLNTCCCEYCANITLKRDAINNFLAAKGLHRFMLPSKVATSDLTLCDKEINIHGRKSCIDRKCSNCGVHLLKVLNCGLAM
ncbi:hypothetical protein ACJMK2_007104 [Sinanodonta woodiana]|uniref:Uncharacterized protein n=1 Tax=Sinanodonta woodiana TaxID=1069815 RepID=A0ABD3VIP2_SINWO